MAVDQPYFVSLNQEKHTGRKDFNRRSDTWRRRHAVNAGVRVYVCRPIFVCLLLLASLSCKRQCMRYICNICQCVSSVVGCTRECACPPTCILHIWAWRSKGSRLSQEREKKLQKGLKTSWETEIQMCPVAFLQMLVHNPLYFSVMLLHDTIGFKVNL